VAEHCHATFRIPSRTMPEMENSSSGASPSERLLQRLAAGRVLSWLAAGCVICMVAFAARDHFTERFAASPPGSVLDKRMWYTPEQASDYFDRIGPTGRQVYAITQFTLDLAFPILYTLLFIGAIVRWCPQSFARGLLWVPVGIFLVDIAENSLLVYFAYHPQERMVAQVASACTTIKWTLVGACVLGFLIGRFVLPRTKAAPPQ